MLASSAALLRPLHRAVAAVHSEHPGRCVVVRESGSEVTVHAIQDGAADLGIVSDAVDTTDLEAEVLGEDPLVLVVPGAHPLAGRAGIGFAEVLRLPWVAWGADSALRVHLAAQAQREGVPIRIQASLPGVDGVLELVARDVGVAVLPAVAMLRRRGDDLAEVPLLDHWARRRLLLCGRSAEARPEAACLRGALRSLWRDTSIVGEFTALPD